MSMTDRSLINIINEYVEKKYFNGHWNNRGFEKLINKSMHQEGE